MHWLIVMILALALSVPVGAALATFGGLALEFVLGLLIETGEKIADDPEKKRVALVILGVVLGGVGLCLCFACVGLIAVLVVNR